MIELKYKIFKFFDSKFIRSNMIEINLASEKLTITRFTKTNTINYLPVIDIAKIFTKFI